MGDGAVLLLWRIVETETELRGAVTAGDAASIEGMASAARRVGRLAWRAALRSEYPDADVCYDVFSAPVAAGMPLGVTHCDGLAAVLVSGGRCGVDAERFDRPLERLCPRVMTAGELALGAAGDGRTAVAMWCAKEAMYKFYGRKSLDFRRDLRIESVDMARGIISGRIKEGDRLTVYIIDCGEWCVAYII